jgi:hypothetical protein
VTLHRAAATSIIVRNWSTDQYLESRPFFSTPPLLDYHSVSSASADTAVNELFWLIMRSSEDKVEFLIVTHDSDEKDAPPQTDEVALPCPSSSSATAAATLSSQGDVIGYARMPHWDDRVMLGHEVSAAPLARLLWSAAP